MKNKKSPGRELGQLDSAGTHVYLALYWAEKLAAQNDDPALKEHFTPVASDLETKLDLIFEELNVAKGKPVDLGGYYHPDPETMSVYFFFTDSYSESYHHHN